MNIIVVRHGQTDWNLKNILQGRTDIELNNTGIMQAKKTSKELSKEKIDFIYCSPLRRTTKTAEMINKNRNRNLKIIFDDRLLERSFGKFEGRQKVEFKKYWNYEDNFSDNDVETIQALFDRIYNFLSDLENKYKDQDVNILIVTHNGVNLALTSIINSRIPDNIFEYNLLPCEYRKFENVDLSEWRKFNERYKV